MTEKRPRKAAQKKTAVSKSRSTTDQGDVVATHSAFQDNEGSKAKPRTSTGVAILVCGNAGPIGGDLLRRRDIATYWALSTSEAVGVLKRVKPAVCLVRQEHAAMLLKAKPKSSPTAFIVLMDDPIIEASHPLFAAGATALVHALAGERLLEAISELTGLAFAQYPRVAYRTTIEVDTGDESKLYETVNISASGVAVRGLEPMRIGSGVRVEFPLLDPPVATKALVVRCFEQNGTPMAGLAFTSLSIADRGRLIALVEEQLSQHPDDAVTIDVPTFVDDLKLSLGRSDGAGAIDELKTMLRSLHQETKRDSSLGENKALERLDKQLTASQRSSMLGKPAPSWAAEALETQLELHLDRQGRGQPSADTVQRALVLCRNMGSSTPEDDTAQLTELTLTRAALLREVYSEPGPTRKGSKPQEKGKKK